MITYCVANDPDLINTYRERWQQDNNSVYFYPLAEFYRKSGKTEQAIELCKKGLSKHPYYWGARVVLARAYIEQDQLDEARKQLETVVEIVPYNLTAAKLLAQIYTQQGYLSKAVARYKTIAGFYPEDTEISKRIRYLIKTELPRKKKLLATLEQWRENIRKNNFSTEKTP